MAPGFQIRSATTADAEGISQVQHVTWHRSYLGLLPHEILAGLDRDQGVSFWRRVLRGRGSGIAVATLDKAVMGFVSFGASRSPFAGHAGEFYALYVMPEAQGCGVGTALMAQAARNLVRLRLHGAAVWVLEDNSAGRRFYERLAGQPVGEPKPLRYGGRDWPSIREVAYGWPDLRRTSWLIDH